MSEWLFRQTGSCGKGKTILLTLGEKFNHNQVSIFPLQDLIDEGHAATQLVNQLHDVIVENDNLSDKQKSIITEKLAEVDKCLADGADEHLQLISLCATVMQQLTQNC